MARYDTDKFRSLLEKLAAEKGLDLVEIAAYTWIVSGIALHVLQPGVSLPSQAGDITISLARAPLEDPAERRPLHRRRGPSRWPGGGRERLLRSCPHRERRV